MNQNLERENVGPKHSYHRVSPQETEPGGGEEGVMHFGNVGEGRATGIKAVPHGNGDGAVEKRMGSEPTHG